MQIAQMVHGTVAVLFVAMMIAHVYIGTIGMEGAFEAMGEGTVDVNWAKEHHSLWLTEEQARVGPNELQRQPGRGRGDLDTGGIVILPSFRGDAAAPSPGIPNHNRRGRVLGLLSSRAAAWKRCTLA